jgi:RNA polymerase sigma-70 factor (ECF subfamily)
LQSRFSHSLRAGLEDVYLDVEAGMKRKMNLEEETDQQLLSLAKNNADACEALYARYCGRIYQYVLAVLHETDLSNDVVSETFLRLAEHQPRLVKTDEQLWSWLVTVAGNLARNELRRRSRVIVLDEQQTPFQESDTSLQDCIGAHAAEMRDAVRSLPSLERSCIRMRYVNDMTTRDIAATLHRSKRQVTVALGDAYKVLRQKLAYLSPGQR